MPAVLPPEIWLAIIEIAVYSNVISNELWIYTVYSAIFRIPDATCETWRSLCLVSRQFRLFAGPRPHFMRMTEEHTNLPPVSTKFLSSVYPYSRLLQIIDGRSAHSQQLIALAIEWYYGNLIPTKPLLLFQPSSQLPNLQSLSLDGSFLDQGPSFWEHLNTACPSLRFLAIAEAYLPKTPNNLVVFRCLEMLLVDSCLPILGVGLPALKHLSMRTTSAADMVRISRWSKLESLILQEIYDEVDQLDWPLLPNLRLLGIPFSRIPLITTCPIIYGHPLHTLHIYADSVYSPLSRDLNHVEVAIEHSNSTAPDGLQATPKFTIRSNYIYPVRLVEIYDKFDELGLQLTGVPWRVLWRNNRYLVSFRSLRMLNQLGTSYTILRPIHWVQWVASWIFTIIERIIIMPIMILVHLFGILFLGWRLF
ncbi:hypothetical protein M408DRAFT_317610 [Serendipita vermifera MAFF 305830]|uniref:F-box domain-containing protein n=1 Tax=Serendipita vermifera MAFF 305830 TaxID=933852 RepID=A0A0C3AYN2_SERVB|nr:hypothetical protein M408DRAFT_317610 [Serendipita vermifera MAFF 305830]